MSASSAATEQTTHPASGFPRRGDWRHWLTLGLALWAVWLIWSGHFKAFLVIAGLASSLFVLALSRRMGIDAEWPQIRFLPRLIAYIPWLFKEIVLANVDVAYRILHPRIPIQPKILAVRAQQRGELGQVIFANSITLTPGTVSVRVADDHILVYALTERSAAGVRDGAMNRRVARVEGAA